MKNTIYSPALFDKAVENLQVSMMKEAIEAGQPTFDRFEAQLVLLNNPVDGDFAVVAQESSVTRFGKAWKVNGKTINHTKRVETFEAKGLFPAYRITRIECTMGLDESGMPVIMKESLTGTTYVDCPNMLNVDDMPTDLEDYFPEPIAVLADDEDVMEPTDMEVMEAMTEMESAEYEDAMHEMSDVFME